MIHVLFYREAGAIVEFWVSGHAGLAPHGQDVLCAAVSALTQATLIGLEEVLGLRVDAEVDDADGKLRCRLPAAVPGDRRDGAAVLTETLLRSLRSIQAGYPDHVQIREVHR
ncbi:MAG TPA: ribosomal-processing cysteine protease Prp [Bacillota bacterium]